MKKICSIALLLLVVVACNKELKEAPRSLVTGDAVFTSVQGLQNAVNGAYQPLKNGYASGFASAAVNAVLMGADDITTHQASNKQEFREMDQFAVNSNNSRMNAIWLGCYKTIQNANNIIDNYKKVTGDAATINQLGGEAYFLRAFSYFWLVRLWGNIPVITTNYDVRLLSIKKSNPQKVYELIESDLKQAEVMMGNTKPSASRVNAGAAKALLAEVYLTEGGYPVNDASKYALAAAKAKEVIDNKARYGFDLVPDLANLWTGTTVSNNTPEDIFALQFCNSCGNGVSLYGKSSMPDPEESGWSDYFAEVTFFNNFPAGKRKDITFHTIFKTAKGDLLWQNSITKHPYYNKFRVNAPSMGFPTSGSDMAVKLFRYAQVLLTYAEATARSGSLPTDAFAAVNQIRKRAGLTDLSPALDANAFADAVANERAWEFAGEYNRWFDLQRLQLVESANSNKAADDMKPLKAITKEKYWLPVPYTDLQINQHL